MSCFSRFLISLGSILIAFGGFVTPISAATTLDSAVTSFQAISELRKKDPIDADALLLEYQSVLQTLAQQVDTQFALSLDSDLLVAIEDIKINNEPTLAAQVIDKTLQRVFFQTILERITSAHDDFANKNTAELVRTWDEAAAAFEAIRETAARDNKVITTDRQSIETGANPSLDVLITDAFARGRTALNKANADEDKITIGIERQNIRLSLIRAYYIGVLREVEGVISNRDRELAEALEKQKEGEIFYRIIESFVARDNPAGNILIKTQLTDNVADIVADEIVSELSKGFIGRVKGELGANEESVGSDREKAKIVAEEALLYTNVFADDLELRLGITARNILNNALTDLTAASNDGDVSKADVARQTIIDTLTSYENELVLATYNKTNTTSFVDPAVLSFQSIGVLRKQDPVDADAIAAEYVGELQQLTQFIDASYGLTLNSIILTALEDIRNGKDIKLAVQVIDKTLQRVFAIGVYDRTTLVLNAFENLSTDDLALEWDRAYTAYLALIGTAARDNKVLSADRQSIETGSNPNLDSKITVAFIRGKNALNKVNADDKANLAVEREAIVLSLVRSFLIGVLREVEGIIANRGREIEEAREKQVEGEFFYRIVEGFISQDNPSGNSVIQSQLTGSLSNVVAEQIVSEISRGLIGQLNRNLNINESTLGADQIQAIVAAERASLNVDVFISDLELTLGSLQRVKIENALRNLKDATDTNDASKASEARQIISTIIANYSNQLI
tara:strand:+ start:201 stop:2426 length:2226 start_codon:yes stop_codon:yes gene_type:complete